jgi:hypothetical protein
MTIKPLLDFIAEHESEGAARRLKISAYDVVWSGISKKHRPASLQRMTVGEVLNWQDSIDPVYRSEASGRYQIMEDTLRGLYAEAGVRLTDYYNAATQDRLAVQLLKRRGLDRYVAGKMTVEQFANSLAKEWASLPVVSGAKKGKSFYAGDGLNASLVDVGPFLAAVRAVKDAPVEVAPVSHKPERKPQIGVGALVAAIMAGLGLWLADLFEPIRNFFGG